MYNFQVISIEVIFLLSNTDFSLLMEGCSGLNYGNPELLIFVDVPSSAKYPLPPKVTDF